MSFIQALKEAFPRHRVIDLSQLRQPESLSRTITSLRQQPRTMGVVQPGSPFHNFWSETPPSHYVVIHENDIFHGTAETLLPLLKERLEWSQRENICAVCLKSESSLNLCSQCSGAVCEPCTVQIRNTQISDQLRQRDLNLRYLCPLCQGSQPARIQFDSNPQNLRGSLMEYMKNHPPPSGLDEEKITELSQRLAGQDCLLS